jgi:hypothetical protein
MEKNGYYLPDSCLAGNDYYLKIKSNSEFSEYRKVIFMSYRPHPAEVLIRDREKPRMVYRSDLFAHQVCKE